MGHGDADWDWADPWGQGASWGAPGWAPGAERTPESQPGGSPPPAPSHTSKEELDGGHPIGSVPDGAGVAGSGWGRHHSGGGERPGVAPTVAAGAALGAGGEATADAAEKGATRNEGGVTELARALAEAATELEEARKVQAELRQPTRRALPASRAPWFVRSVVPGKRTALKEEEEGKAAALAAATAAEEKTEKAEAFALRQAESAKENATAAGQWLVSLGLEREELKGQLAAAQTNSTSLLEELSALKESAVEAELRANSSEAKLRMAMEDIEVLDEGLKLFMDGDGQPRQQSSRAGPLSWRRVSEAYLRPLLPSKLKAPTPEELEALKLNRSLGRALENNTALAEAVSSKDDLVKELNSRIKQFQLHAVRRKKGYRALKLGLAELTNEVQAKETMMTILTVCMLGTSSILEGMDATLDAQAEADFGVSSAGFEV
ncbi:expressed unknown protein [Ectocarpus siliculosus]|uniref:Uncharacterized protein n=1 Tax=Ectocarpus siliculosus TaxID=2880 RepID=D7FUP1_ECTSI|nr:expressed unknown protein [Ectocarpus siliculosus]|eukprot:CBJ31685.1 expressed unknown protein [Ectocarpus siliculosus]